MYLIPGTVALLEVGLADPQVRPRPLGALVPASWPPDLYDPPAIQWSIPYLREHPEAAGWGIPIPRSRELPCNRRDHRIQGPPH